jgi:hypothetical protein
MQIGRKLQDKFPLQLWIVLGGVRWSTSIVFLIAFQAVIMLQYKYLEEAL